MAQVHYPEVAPLQMGQASGRKRKAADDQYQSRRSRDFRNAPQTSRTDEHSYPENSTTNAHNDAPQSPFGVASDTGHLPFSPDNAYDHNPGSLQGAQDTIQGSSHDHYLPPDFFGLGNEYETAPADGYEDQNALEVASDEDYFPETGCDAPSESAYEHQNDLEALDDDDEYDEYEPGSAYEPDQESFDEQCIENDYPLEDSEADGGYEAGPSNFKGDKLPYNQYSSRDDTTPSTSRVWPLRNRSAYNASRTEASNPNAQETEPAPHIDPILFQLEPPPGYGLDTLVPLRDSSGKVIVDGKGREYKRFPGLPREVPVRLDDHTLLLYTDRTDPRIQHRDLVVRMRPRLHEKIPRENALNMQRSRYRNKHNLACWTRKTKLPSLRDCLLMEVIDPASVDHNTISRVSERGIEVAMTEVGRLPLDAFVGDGQVHVASRDLWNVFQQIARLQDAAERENIPHWIFLPNRLKPKEWMKKAVAAKRKQTNGGAAVKRDHAEDIIFPVELPAASLDWIKRCVTDAAEYGYPVPRLSSLPPHIHPWMAECIREGRNRASWKRRTQARNLNGEDSHSRQRTEQNEVASQGTRTRTQQHPAGPSMSSGHNSVRHRANAEYPPRADPGLSSSHHRLHDTERDRPTLSQDWKGQSQETVNQVPGMASSSKRKRSIEDDNDHEHSKRAKLAQQELDRFKAAQASRPSRNGKNPARPYGPRPAQHPPRIRSYETAADTNRTEDYQMNSYTQDLQNYPAPMAEWPSYRPMSRVEPQQDTEALDNEDNADYDASGLTPRAHQPASEDFPIDLQENNMYGNDLFDGSEQEGQFESGAEQKEEGLDQAVRNFLQDSEQAGQAEIYEEEQQVGDIAETSSDGRQLTSTDPLPLLQNDSDDDDFNGPMSIEKVGEVWENFETQGLQ